MASRIQLRRGTAAEWTNTTPSPVLAEGELGFETDTGKLKIGDGTTTWAALTYVAIQGVQGTTGPAGSGAQGTTGAQGATGTQGANGLQGIPGPNGTQGTDGAQGASGGGSNIYDTASTSTGYFALPVGTGDTEYPPGTPENERPEFGSSGMVRYNTSFNQVEFNVNGVWRDVKFNIPTASFAYPVNTTGDGTKTDFRYANTIPGNITANVQVFVNGLLKITPVLSLDQFTGDPAAGYTTPGEYVRITPAPSVSDTIIVCTVLILG